MPRMNIARDASRIPLAPVAFNMDQGIDLGGMRFAGLKLEFFSNPRSYDNFEFGVNVSPYPDRFVFECMYNSNLWDRETMARRMEELGFFPALPGPRDPDQELGHGRAFCRPRRGKESSPWLRGPFLEVPADRTVVDLIQEQARERPGAEAVCHDGKSLSYAELNRRANSLARFLMDAGVGPGKLVGLCLERSPDMIVAILGVLKAGGAYVPLEPGLAAQEDVLPDREERPGPGPGRSRIREVRGPGGRRKDPDRDRLAGPGKRGRGRPRA